MKYKDIEKELKIRNWIDLYEIIDEYKIFKFYFVIDQIDDLSTFRFFQKKLQKIFAIVNCFTKIRMIIISNFDLCKSELKNDFNFDDFISVQYPQKNNSLITKIVKEHIDIKPVSNFIYNDIINKCVLSFQYPFANLNETIYASKEVIKKYQNVTKENYDTKKVIKDIFEPISFSPLHVKQFDINAIKNNFNLTYKKTFCHSDINLTDSLSFCQKIILLSAFIASETSPYNDNYIMKNSKKEHLVIRRSIKREYNGVALRDIKSFSIQRLIAIYSSLYSIITNISLSNDDINVNLLADIGTLETLSLLIPKSKQRDNFNTITSQKFICGFAADFAIKIAEDVDIHLDDFVYINI